MSEDFTQKLPENGNQEILAAITKIDHRLQSLEKKVEEKLYDTRPIWHKVIADIAELQSGQKRLEEGQKHLDHGQQSLRVSITQLHSSVHDVSRDQIVINDVIRRLQMDFHNIDEKLYKLTVNRNQQNSQT